MTWRMTFDSVEIQKLSIVTKKQNKKDLLTLTILSFRKQKKNSELTSLAN